MVILNGCNHQTQRDDSIILSHYPLVIKFSPTRYQTFIKEWKDFSLEYHLNLDIKPEFDSVLMVPHITPFINGISLSNSKNDSLTMGEAEERLYSFLKKWGGLFNTTNAYLFTSRKEYSPGIQNRVKFIHGEYHITIKKNPISYLFNTIDARIYVNGIIEILIVKCVPDDPQVDPYRYHDWMRVPEPKITFTEALKIYDNHPIQYWSFGGKKTRFMNASSIRSMECTPTYVPRYTFINHNDRLDSVEFRLCWKVTDQEFNVYIDAMTGEFLDYHDQLFTEL